MPVQFNGSIRFRKPSVPFKARFPLAKETAKVTRARDRARRAEIATQNRKHGHELLTGDYVIEMRRTVVLKPPELNDGAFDLDHIGRVEDSIVVFGFTGFILIDPDDVIIAGVNADHAAMRPSAPSEVPSHPPAPHGDGRSSFKECV